MNIKIITTNSNGMRMPLYEVKIGQVFKYGDSIFMKAEDVLEVKSINLFTGVASYIRPVANVTVFENVTMEIMG